MKKKKSSVESREKDGKKRETKEKREEREWGGAHLAGHV